MKKKILSLCTVLSLFISLCMPVSAVSTSETPTMTKREFLEYCHELRQNSPTPKIVLSQEEVDDLIIQYILSSSDDKKEIEVQLNAAGFFIYSDSTQLTTQPYSEPNDITISGAMVLCDENTGNWSISAGGTWRDKNLSAISDEAGFWLHAIGSTKNIGGYDAVGLVIYNTSGRTPSLVRSYAQINDGAGHSVRLTNPSTYNSGRGIAFQYQDYITVTETSMTGYKFNYYGYGYVAVMTFDNSFLDWNGTARGYYAHTWSNTTIDSIGFNLSTTYYGLNISWSENKNHFLAFSNMDTKF